jgi:hypothetical protein
MRRSGTTRGRGGKGVRQRAALTRDFFLSCSFDFAGSVSRACVCVSKVDYTHDGGLGFFAWLHALPVVALDPLVGDHWPWPALPLARALANATAHPPAGPPPGSRGGGRARALPPLPLLAAYCSKVAFHGPGRAWDPRAVHALLAQCPAESAAAAGLAAHRWLPYLPNDGATRLAWWPQVPRQALELTSPATRRDAAATGPPHAAGRTRPPVVDVASFHGEDCLRYTLPPGLRLGPDGRSCLCASDGQPTADGQCTDGRWTGKQGKGGESFLDYVARRKTEASLSS